MRDKAPLRQRLEKQRDQLAPVRGRGRVRARQGKRPARLERQRGKRPVLGHLDPRSAQRDLVWGKVLLQRQAERQPALPAAAMGKARYQGSAGRRLAQRGVATVLRKRQWMGWTLVERVSQGARRDKQPSQACLQRSKAVQVHRLALVRLNPCRPQFKRKLAAVLDRGKP